MILGAGTNPDSLFVDHTTHPNMSILNNPPLKRMYPQLAQTILAYIYRYRRR